MAETTLLRNTGLVRNASPAATASGPQAQVSGQHKVVNVTMGPNGPQQSTGQMARQGVTILPPKAGKRTFTTGGLPNQGAKPGVVIMPPKEQRAGAATAAPQFSADQLLLFRHLVDKYLGETRAAAGEAQLDQAAADNVKLAEGAIASIDSAMEAITAAAAVAAAPPPAAPPPRAVAVGGRQSATAAPRRVARPGNAPPPVVVKMEGKTPVQQVPDQVQAQEEAPAESDVA